MTLLINRAVQTTRASDVRVIYNELQHFFFALDLRRKSRKTYKVILIKSDSWSNRDMPLKRKQELTHARFPNILD